VEYFFALVTFDRRPFLTSPLARRILRTTWRSCGLATAFLGIMIRDEDDFSRHFDYIHYNPVKHGYVKRPHDWKWSSYHRYRKRGYYQDDWDSAAPHSFGNGGFGE